MGTRLLQLGGAIAAIVLCTLFCAMPADAEILFIGGQADATQGDDGDVFAHLEDAGYDVTYMQASQSDTADGEDVDLIILSSTPGSGDMRGKFQDLPTPILNWEEALMRDTAGNFNMSFASGNGGDLPSDTIVIQEDNHPIVQLAGFEAGEIVVYDDFLSLAWASDLAPGTAGIATNLDDDERYVLSAIEAGEELSDGFPAEGPRVNFFTVDTGFANLTAEGLSLFDASVSWLLGDVGGGDPQLEAGDANMDYEFNQLDLVQVQIAAKYLSGTAANWGEGDWDGAPGGTAGSPPPGNGFFDQLDIVAALTGGKYLLGPYAAIGPNGVEDDEQTSIVYNAETGEVSVDAPAGTELTSVNIDSAAGIFVNNENAQNLDGSFDTHSDDNIFKATFGSSFGSLSFGMVASTDLAKDFVANDLTVIGSLDGGGGLGDVDLVYVPEPSAVLLLTLGVVGLLTARRRR